MEAFETAPRVGLGCAANQTSIDTHKKNTQAWRFFRERIRFEEQTLRRMFGPRYDAYARATPTWIPGIP